MYELVMKVLNSLIIIFTVGVIADIIKNLIN